MSDILDCLKKHGQRLDLEIAQEMKMPLASVRGSIDILEAEGAVVTCRVTRFEDGKRIDARQCRVSGYTSSRLDGATALRSVAPRTRIG